MVPAPPSPAFFYRLFFLSMASGGWKTIIDFSALKLSVVKFVFSDGICFGDSPLDAVLRMCGFNNLSDCPSGWEFLRVVSSSGS